MTEINWKRICRGCGECCGPVPFERSFYMANKHKRTMPVKNEIHGAFQGMILPLTEYGECPFLSAKKKCAIYVDRPLLCKLYGTIPEMKCPKL